MIFIRLLPVLLLLSRIASRLEAAETEIAKRSSPPILNSFLAAGLTPAIADDIQSDLLNKRFSKAEAKLISRIDATAHPQPLLEILGKVFFLDSNYLQAAIAYKKAETYDVLSDDARFTLVMSYIELKRTNWARDELLKLIKDRPDKPLYRYWLGRLEYDDQKFSDALASFRAVIQIDHQFVRAYDGSGLCEEAIGSLDSAAHSYERANVLNREQGSPYPSPALDYGTMLAKLGRYGEATSLLREALTIDPSLAKAYYELGRVEEKTAHTEAAIADFEAASKLDPGDSSPVYALFRLYTKMGKKELATAMMVRFRLLKKQSNSGP